jgi:hypothetical protein
MSFGETPPRAKTESKKLSAVYMQLAIAGRLAKARETRKNSCQRKIHSEYLGYVYFLYLIPDPNADLQLFLSAQQGLSNAIDMILAQENMSQNPSDVGSLPSRPLIFANNWLSSEVGIQTDGTKLDAPEAGGKFGGYRVRSFLTGLAPVPLSQGSIYVIKQSNPTYQALVYPMPTSHPCVNRLVLAADNTAGSWPPPTYALGRYQLDSNGLPMRDRPLITYLIVNICLDLGTLAGRQSTIGLTPKCDSFWRFIGRVKAQDVRVTGLAINIDYPQITKKMSPIRRPALEVGYSSVPTWCHHHFGVPAARTPV